jgi:nucleoside-diphosphate-sugar epimerase
MEMECKQKNSLLLMMLVEANILAAKGDIVEMVFNIGGGSRISVNDLITKMDNILEKMANIKYVEKQKGDVKDTLADTSKISVLGWKPSVKIEEGLKRFTKWCKNK